MKKKFVDIITALLIVLFAYTALSKLADYYTFKLQIGKSPFINEWAGFVAWFIPASELICVLLLLINRTRLLGLYASLYLMTLFTTYIFFMLQFSPHLPCSCGGIISDMSWTQHLWFNIFFTLLTVAGILFDKEPPAGVKDMQKESNPAVALS